MGVDEAGQHGAAGHVDDFRVVHLQRLLRDGGDAPAFDDEGGVRPQGPAGAVEQARRVELQRLDLEGAH